MSKVIFVVPCWIMHLMGGLDRYIDRYNGRDIGRYIGRYSIDTTVEYQPMYRSIVYNWWFTDTSPILHRYFTDTSPILQLCFNDTSVDASVYISVDTSADTQSVHALVSVDTRSSIDRYSYRTA